ncbi:MAG: DUF2726 domain-containing protein [Caldilineaceae bacterium]|nr:DUF2726 domain-containing protein [Caldilineaceae bacterium]
MPLCAVRDSVLDPVEHSLYRALTLVLCQRAVVLTKLALGDLFWLPPHNDGSTRLPQPTIDFVICDRDSLRPLGVILLEEAATHREPTSRTAQITQSCAQAGLPVVCLPRQQAYLMHQLTPLIEPLLQGPARQDDPSQDDRSSDPLRHAQLFSSKYLNKAGRSTPAYPGYGVLRNLGNKLA